MNGMSEKEERDQANQDALRRYEYSLRIPDSIPAELVEQVVEDFYDWSGGYTPDECTDQEVWAYIATALPAEFEGRRQEVVRILLPDSK